MNAIVCAIRDTATHLRRISVKHELLKEIGPIAPGTHFKVFIPLNKNSRAVLPDVSSGRAIWADEEDKPYIRTYTVRNIDRVNGILDVEFVLHGDTGPASAWAGNASVGDYLGIGLKKSGKTQEKSDCYLFAGDETAIPAISAMLEVLPAETIGFAFLEVETEADKFHIRTDSAIEIRWLIRNGIPPEQSQLILNAVKKIVLPNPMLRSRYIWIAGEDQMVKVMRRYAAEELELNREELHATVYWKAGLSEDNYSKIRLAQ